MDKIVSKSELATELDCSKSSITSLIARGLPVRADGQIGREAALRWIVKCTSGHHGGWSQYHGHRRPSLCDRAEALLTGSPARSRTRGEAEDLLQQLSEAEAGEDGLTDDPTFAVLDHIRAQYQHLPRLLLWLAGELAKCPEAHKRMIAAMLAPEVAEALLVSADDLSGYHFRALPEPDHEAIAREAGLAMTPEVRQHAEDIADRMGDVISLLGMWGPECKRYVEAERKKKQPRKRPARKAKK